MEIETEFTCSFCGEINTTTIDASAGKRQEYVEDCQVCCHPNLLHIEADPEMHLAAIEAEED